MLRVALLVSAGALAAAPASAATYNAKLAGAVDGRIVAREINWSCAGRSCSGATNDSRPAVLCQALAKRAGRIDAFLIDGEPLGTAELDKCNSGAKAAGSKAVAAQ